MNREIKRVSTIVLAMFLALLVSTSILQVFQADALTSDARNSRARNDSYSQQRGAILVAGQPVAQSVPSDDVYKFQRVYSNGPLYSSVTGFFPINGQATGLEGALNDKLSGSSNSQFFDRVNAILTGKNPQGASVETTIDPVAQQAAYDALGNYQGAVVLLEPKTGRILAMVSKPNYDPNTLASHDTKQVNALLPAASRHARRSADQPHHRRQPQPSGFDVQAGHERHRVRHRAVHERQPAPEPRVACSSRDRTPS